MADNISGLSISYWGEMKYDGYEEGKIEGAESAGQITGR